MGYLQCGGVAVWGSCGVGELWDGDVAVWGCCGVGGLRCGGVAVWGSCCVGVAAYGGPSGYQTLDHCVLGVSFIFRVNCKKIHYG